MDIELEKAAYYYCDIVKEKCEILLKHIYNSEKVQLMNKHELFHYISDRSIYEYQYDGVKYVFHGSGCTAFENDVIVADWDFGYRNLWCGINPFKMALTLKNTNYTDSMFYNAEYIKELCEKYTEQNDLIFYNNQYYINLLVKGTQKTNFPADYDEMIIWQNGKEIKCQRSKVLDKFIRKSREIYKDIDTLGNNSILIFMDKSKEVYRIPYNDVAYPDAAVDIMTNLILKQNSVAEIKKDE